MLSSSGSLILGVSSTLAMSAFAAAVVRGVVLLALVAIGLTCWRRSSAAMRHMVWVMATVGLLMLPIMSLVLPGWTVLPPRLDIAAAVNSATEDERPENTPVENLPTADSLPPVRVESVEPIPSRTELVEPIPEDGLPSTALEVDATILPTESLRSDDVAVAPAAGLRVPDVRKPTVQANADPQETAAAWLLGIWSVGATVLLLRLLASQFSLWRLTCRSSRVTDGNLLESVKRIASSLSVRRSVCVYLSCDRHIPMTWGLFAPRLLLPADAVGWDSERLQAVLAHELAHVKRWDCQTQLLAQVACALHWLNPLAWFALWRISLERERACDDTALSSGIVAADYAEHLIGIVSGLSRRELASYTALAMARPSRLARRLSVLLDEKLNRRSVTTGVMLATIVALTAIIVPISIIRAATPPDVRTTTVAAAEAEPRAERDAIGHGVQNGNWSEPIEGLQFRLSAPRTEFQSWELPTFVLEVRNRGDKAVTEERAQSLFGDDRHGPGLRFLFKDQYKRAFNPNVRVAPRIHVDVQKIVGLKIGDSMKQTLTLMAMGELTSPQSAPFDLKPGRYTIGVGKIGSRLAADLKTNAVTLNILPPGVKNIAELAAFLKPYRVNNQSLKAGFVPNKTTVVWGEPMFVTLTVQNLDEETFTFEFGGDYRGSGRHERFKIKVTDSDGKLLPDPSRGFEGGGILSPRVVRGRDAVVETVELADFRSLPGPGEYSVSCRFDLVRSWVTGDKPEFRVPVETTYKLTILPREPANVQRVLAELFDQSYKTSGTPLGKLIDTICSFGKEAAVPGLVKMATDSDATHRIAAIRGLGKVTTPQSLDTLLQADQKEQIAVRVAAITALGAFTDPPAVEAAVKALSDPNDLVCTTAATALGSMKTDAAINALIVRLPDAQPSVGAAVLRAMGATQSSRVFDIIVRSLANDEDAIRRAAVDAVINFPAEQAANALKPYTADSDMDFREEVIRKLAESLKQPIDPKWLVPVIKSRNGARSIGDVPRLLRLYTGDKAAPALLSCLDFENPAVRNHYNLTIMDNQLACDGLAVPWIADLNRDGTPDEIAQNRRTLRCIKHWIDHYEANPWTEPPPPWRLDREDEEKTWGDPVDDLSIRARVYRSVWPAGLPQVVTIDARGHPGQGSVNFSKRPDPLEVEVNGTWYHCDPNTSLRVTGSWNAYHGNPLQDIQLDNRWRRKSDGHPLDLTPGKYVVRIRLSIAPKDKQTGLAMSRPIEFEVIPTQSPNGENE